MTAVSIIVAGQYSQQGRELFERWGELANIYSLGNAIDILAGDVVTARKSLKKSLKSVLGQRISYGFRSFLSQDTIS